MPLFPNLQGLDACVPCNLVGLLSNTAYALGEQMHGLLRTGVTNLLAAFLGLYILIHAGKLLFPFGAIDRASGVMNAVATRTLLTIGAMTFMLSFANYWNYIHTPPLAAGLSLTSTIMDAARGELTRQDYIAANCADQVTGQDAEAMRAGLTCTMRNAQASLLAGIWAGVNGMFISIQGSAVENAMDVNTATTALIIGVVGGLILLAVYLPLYVALPIKMADVIIRWTILAVLSPLVVAAFVFPVTRSFLFAALKGIMQAGLELVLYGVVVAFGAFAIDRVLEPLGQQGGRTYATLINTALFWQLLLIGTILGTLLKKVRMVAIALSDPTSNPMGMNVGVASDLGDRVGGMVAAATVKAATGAKGVWKSRMS